MNGEDQLLRSDIIDRNVRQSLNLSWINFAVLFCAVIIACVGLNMDSVAVIIGAMLISPIMDPIIGMGYGVAVRDSSMLKKAVVVFLIEIVVGLIAATIYFALSPIKDASEQLLARTQPAIWDVLIAFFGGFAGIIGSAKKEPGNILPGVAIATALIPPLSTVGYGLSQFKWSIVFSAGYLFLINSFFIALATMIGTLIFNFRKNRASGIPLKNQMMIIVAAIIITIPSLISASTLVKQTYNDTQLTNFISKEMPDQYVVDKSFDNNKIKLVVMGQNITNSELKQLDKKLDGYQLGGYKLQLNQLSKGNYLSVNDFKQYVAHEKNGTTQQTTSSDDQSELLSFKKKITEKYPDTIEKVYIGELAQKNKTGKALILVQWKQDQATTENEQVVSDFVKSEAKKQDLEYTLHFTED
ncbi:DUF389 domain-containing protein [Companilactobacillus zhongbaensis]|uniref:DUF389 domain-containing protein n=1 Tax=Companilactobacillus zhongbaensis TaxID=2486009 RepID=UPI000F7AC42B|nr:DUF389 domain-containing protein [Companilactobacillus zhongbaensis]